MDASPRFTAFVGSTLLVSGPLRAMILRTKAWLDAEGNAATRPALLIFDDDTGRQIDFDFEGSAEEVVDKLADHPSIGSAAAVTAQKAGPGRPKLGVTAREVTLLPRHWEWLESQSQYGGVSGALRRLVEDARKRNAGADLARACREAASRVMWSLAGNFPNFEEASRALFANDLERFSDLTLDWPVDVRSYLSQKLEDAARLDRDAVNEARVPSR